MAYIGLAFPTFAKLDQATGTYSDGFRFGKAVSVNATINYNEANISGDNVIAESVREFRDGTIDLGITTIPIEAYSTVFGHEVVEDELDGTVTIIDKTDDIAHYGGLGLVKEEMVEGERKHIAMWFKKVQFTETGENATTKGETITFQAPTISGNIFALDDRTWRERKIFNTQQEAIDYIDGLAGITPSA